MSALRLPLALTTLALAALACRPVITIGTGEIIVFFILLLALFGPPLFRLWARWEAFKRHEKERKKK